MNDDANLAAIGPFLRELGKYQMERYRGLRADEVRVKERAAFGEAVVTECDIESERRVAAFLQERFPGESFLGEETGNIRRDPSRYWVLDPIDGTSNFTQGIAYWGPTLARIIDGRISGGWIHLPVLDELFEARRGGGATLNGRSIRAADVAEYTDLTTVATTSLLHRRARLTVPAKHRILGSLVVNLAYLATGTFAAIYCRGRVWDLAGGVLIAREAGAHIECRPDLEGVDLAALEPGAVPSVTVTGRANDRLPPIDSFLSRNDG